MIEQSLVRLGLKDKEVLIFRTLLELGAQPAGVIAKRTGINRGSMYVLLDTLVSKGLISRIVKAGVQTFATISPEEIIDIIRTRKRDLDAQELELKGIIPQLQAMMSKYITRPKVRHYEGIEGIQTVMEEGLMSSETILSYASVDAWEGSPLHDFFHDYCHRRSFEAKVPLKCLAYDTPVAREHFEVDHALFEVHFIPKEVVFEWSLINIFENKMLMISLIPNNMCGIIIESQEIVSMQKAIFELAWRGCDPQCLAIHR